MKNVTATAADVLSGKIIVDSTKKEITGTMPNNGAISKSITPSTSAQYYTIPAGYHNGSGKVNVAAAPTSLIDGDATAANVLSGKTFFADSYTKKTGTMPNQGAKTASLNAGDSYAIPAGYHNGSGKVTANSLASQTSATATASDILSGKTAWVNGSKVTGALNPVNITGLKIYANAAMNSFPTATVSSAYPTHTFTLLNEVTKNYYPVIKIIADDTWKTTFKGFLVATVPYDKKFIAISGYGSVGDNSTYGYKTLFIDFSELTNSNEYAVCQDTECYFDSSNTLYPILKRIDDNVEVYMGGYVTSTLEGTSRSIMVVGLE